MNKASSKNSLLKIIFVLSLALNLFFGSMFVSKYVYHSDKHLTPPERLYSAIELLEPQYQEDVRVILDEQIPQVEANFKKMFFLFKDMRSAMTSTEFDPGQMMGFREQIMGRHQEMTATFAQTLMRVSMALPADQRKVFFEAALPETPPIIPPEMLERILETPKE